MVHRENTFDRKEMDPLGFLRALPSTVTIDAHSLVEVVHLLAEMCRYCISSMCREGTHSARISSAQSTPTGDSVPPSKPASERRRLKYQRHVKLFQLDSVMAIASSPMSAGPVPPSIKEEMKRYEAVRTSLLQEDREECGPTECSLDDTQLLIEFDQWP